MFKLYCTAYLLMSSIAYSYGSDITDYLQERAQYFIYQQLEIPENTIARVTATKIDERLSLSRCEEMLTISLPAKIKIRNNTIVYMHCAEEKSWDLYLPVKVSIQKAYATVTDRIAKHSRLDSPQLTLAYQEQSLFRSDYFHDLTQLEGVRSLSELRPGQPIRSSQVCLICKDDLVTLIAENSTIQVKTTARSLQNGNINDIVEVKNLSSGKIVQGKITAKDTVTIKI